MNEGHIVKRFDQEIEHLNSLILEMGQLAISQLTGALESLANEDPEHAYNIIARDSKLNDLDSQSNDEIIRLIAKRQPVARDLRELIAIGKIVSDLERAGDEARKIAGLTIRFFEPGNKPPSDEILTDIHQLAEYVCKMLQLSMNSFGEQNMKIAGKVIKRGLKLDNQLQSIIRRLSTFIMEDPRNIGHFIDIVLGIRALERFGGHAKNIAGHIVFIQTGEDLRHVADDEFLRSIGKN
ncbi:MAG: phosphate signaling complex protein PhoU [Gammaproteobacteria bacterium]|nr:phosphate signaling complex protein PhoU [Gammaproteobacteria bacterium]MCY4217891.1 phosphate signaling complex protein PhoU [Gammaproteobacteria bacterium]MCY4274180.1 phosphate signaling complex protein PhoU [Gammaproteobacteria bacterium]